MGKRSRGIAYLPIEQYVNGPLVLTVRSAGDPLPAAALLKRTIASVDPDLAVDRAGTAFAVIGGPNCSTR